MLNGLKAEFSQLRNLPVGHRFVACYERHQARAAPWLTPVLYFAAIFSLVLGVILVFIPGPAILFFAIAGALLAAESRRVASAFDNVELWCRARYAALRGRRSDARATTKALSPQAAAVIAARAEHLQAKPTRRRSKRRSVRGSAELVPTAEEPKRNDEAVTGQPDASARSELATAHSGAGASGDRGPRRDAVVPPVAAATPIARLVGAKPAARSTQAYAPNMQERTKQNPVRVAGTVELWAPDRPAPHPNNKSTARLRRPRKRAAKPSIVTLPPPVIIGVKKA